MLKPIVGWRPLKGYLANTVSDQGLHYLQIVQPFFFRNIYII